MDKNLKSNSGAGVYSGRINLKLKNGGLTYKTVKQHNSGTAEFFKYILNCVKGSILPNDRPGHVKLIYDTGISRYGVMYESVSDAESYGSSENPMASITYKFLIPETIVKSGTIVGLQLESVRGVVYAVVELENSVDIDVNTNIELEWELNLTNN